MIKDVRYMVFKYFFLMSQQPPLWARPPSLTRFVSSWSHTRTHHSR